MRPKELFSKIEQDTSETLCGRVLMRIKHAQKRKALTNFIGLGLISLVSLSLFVPAVNYIGSEMQVSGFSSYLSILFSNSGSVLANWREFTLALAESLPIFSIVLFLVAALVFFISFKIFIKNISAVRLSF